MAPQVDIKIVSLNNNSSSTSSILDLNKSANNTWCDIFNYLWKNHFYQMKRNAESYGNTIIVSCPPSELKDGLLNELKKIVSQANQQYDSHMAKTQEEMHRNAERAKKEKDEIKEIGKQLDFE